MFGAECENDELGLQSHRLQRKLGDEAVLIFNFNVQIFGSENGCCAVDDIGQFSRSQTVIDVIGHPGLKTERGDLSGRSAAVQEGLINTTYLRDMRMRRNDTPVGEEESEVVAGLIPEGFEE